MELYVLKSKEPLVLSCSSCYGCSGTAHIVSYVALALERHGDVEISSITGVARSRIDMESVDQLGQPLVALDGCVMTCCKNYIKQRGREPDLSKRFDKLGLMGQGERAFLP